MSAIKQKMEAESDMASNLCLDVNEVVITIDEAIKVAERYAEGFAEWIDDSPYIRAAGNRGWFNCLAHPHYEPETLLTTAELRAEYDRFLLNQKQG